MGTWTFPMKATSYPVCGRRHQEAQWQLNHDFLDPTPTLPNPSKPWSKPYIGFTARVERAMVARPNKRNDAHELSISLEEKFSDSANGWKWHVYCSLGAKHSQHDDVQTLPRVWTSLDFGCQNVHMCSV